MASSPATLSPSLSSSSVISLRRISSNDFVSVGSLIVSDPLDEPTLAGARSIVESVEKCGESKLRELSTKFGDIASPSATIFLQKNELLSAYNSLSESDRLLLHRTANRVKLFAEAQRRSVTDIEIKIDGGVAGHRVTPVRVAGCYAPGGRYPLPSSVIMTAVTARAAGVEKVYVASPRPSPVTLAAAYVSGADGVLCVGGAHAVAALAFGIGIPSACDVIAGPGNRWVTAAKKLLSGRVGIDMIAGPSEVCVLADDDADAAICAADLIAQAEHDIDARAILVCFSPSFVDAVDKELTRQLSDLPTKETAIASIQRNGLAIVVPDKNIDIALQVVDRIAPEHLELMVNNSTELGEKVSKIGHYGGLFIGSMAAEVLGDYGAGPNHTLPTSGSARFTGGLSVFQFLRIRTYMRIDEPQKSTQLLSDSVALAEHEGLHGHARAAKIRQQRLLTSSSSSTILPSAPLPSSSSSSSAVDPVSYIRSDFSSLMEYTPVQPLEVVSQQIGMPIERLAKLNANENLYGPMPGLSEELEKNAHMHIYPDPDQNALRDAIASSFGIDRSYIVAGAGSDESIDQLFTLFDPQSIITATPTFSMYQFFAQLHKCEVIDVPRSSAPHFSVDINGIINAVNKNGSKIVFLASPNNPTGNLLSTDDIRTLCEQCAGKAVIVIDEAYAEFASSNALSLIHSYNNLILLRTFSKWAGLAGLRVGFTVCHPSFAIRLLQIKQPYNINVAADYAARLALKHRSTILDGAVRSLLYERTRMQSLISYYFSSWLTPLSSDANFFLVEITNGYHPRALQKELFRHGVLVRCYASADANDPLGKFIRISAGRPQDTERLISVLFDIAKSNKFIINNSASSLSLLSTPLYPHLQTPPLAIFFDLDGVLADVSQSYRTAIINTCAAFGVTIISDDIRTAKEAGNANNDWDLTYRLIQNKLSTSSSLPSFDSVKDKFQEIYLGKGGIGGVRETEKLLIDPSLLYALSKQCKLAIVTGRPRDEAIWFLKRYSIDQYFQWISAMEDGPAKPNPYPLLLAMNGIGLLKGNNSALNANTDDKRSGICWSSFVYHDSIFISKNHNNGLIYFIGDTVDDMAAAIGANNRLAENYQATGQIDNYSTRVIGLGILAPQERCSIDNINSSLRSASFLYKAGASRVLTHLHELFPMITPSVFQSSVIYGANEKQILSSINSMPSATSSSSRTEEKSCQSSARIASNRRVTKETSIEVSVSLDGTGRSSIETGVGFLNHMLEALSKHSKIDISLNCKGDLHIDDHHTVEDCALALGTALSTAWGDRSGCTRFGSAYAPLDESLARAVVDLSGRAHADVHLAFERPSIGQLSTEMIVHFFHSLASAARFTLHIDVLRGANDHHRSEAAFKALALAIRQAITKTSNNDIPSTKGTLE